MNVVVSGLTAAGKTTHATLLAEHLGYRYVSASRILAKSAGFDVDPSDHWWLEHGRSISAARDSGRLDKQLDETMASLAERQDCQVFDAWALPWTTSAPMLRVWLESDRPSRYRKCRVSHSGQRDLSLPECAELVDQKDAESRRIFKRLHDFDVFTDHHVFDVILDLSALIPEATQECSRRGIKTADDYLRELAACFCSQAPASPALRSAAKALPPNSVVRAPAARPR